MGTDIPARHRKYGTPDSKLALPMREQAGVTFRPQSHTPGTNDQKDRCLAANGNGTGTKKSSRVQRHSGLSRLPTLTMAGIGLIMSPDDSFQPPSKAHRSDTGPAGVPLRTRMKVFVAEREWDVETGIRLFTLRDRVKPQADLTVCNGAPASADRELREGDRIVFIRRGEVPGKAELEALMMARHTPGVHARVKVATVGIAGAGGLGSAVAVALARTGVGRLVIADFDVVEPSNLNRQQYFVDQIGLPKVEALAANLARINPYVHVVPHVVRLTPGNIPDLFKVADVLVEAFDAADAKAMLLESFGKAFPEKPIVLASGLAGYGPGGTIRVRKLGQRAYVVGDLESDARPGRGLMAPRVGVAAHLQANAVLRLLLGEEPE